MIAWLSRFNPLLVASMLVLSLLLVACSSSSSDSVDDTSPDDEETDGPGDDEEDEDEDDEDEDDEDGDNGDNGDNGDDGGNGDNGGIDPPFGVSGDGAGFRVDFLELQHPHIIADVNYMGIPICADITFDPLEVFLFGEVAPGLNPTIADMIGDLQLNMVQLHDPLDLADGHSAEQAIVDAECDSVTDCSPARDVTLSEGTFSVQDSGACLADIDGLYEGEWPDERATVLNAAAAGEMSCFVTDVTTLELALDMLEEPLVLSLKDVRIAGHYDDDEATMITDGLILGFLSQVDADQVTIDLDIIDLNLGHDLLPAGAGDGQACVERDPAHCSGIEARVTHNGDCGWWFALNFNALRLEDVSGF